jgi:hypothetical protein
MRPNSAAWRERPNSSWAALQMRKKRFVAKYLKGRRLGRFVLRSSVMCVTFEWPVTRPESLASFNGLWQGQNSQY